MSINTYKFKNIYDFDQSGFESDVSTFIYVYYNSYNMSLCHSIMSRIRTKYSYRNIIKRRMNDIPINEVYLFTYSRKNDQSVYYFHNLISGLDNFFMSLTDSVDDLDFVVERLILLIDCFKNDKLKVVYKEIDSKNKIYEALISLDCNENEVIYADDIYLNSLGFENYLFDLILTDAVEEIKQIEGKVLIHASVKDLLAEDNFNKLVDYGYDGYLDKIIIGLSEEEGILSSKLYLDMLHKIKSLGVTYALTDFGSKSSNINLLSLDLFTYIMFSDELKKLFKENEDVFNIINDLITSVTKLGLVILE